MLQLYTPVSLLDEFLSPLSMGRNTSVLSRLFSKGAIIKRLGSLVGIVLPLGSVQTTLAETAVFTTLDTVAVQVRL